MEGNKKKVLIVDDDLVGYSDTFQSIFDRRGIELAMADNFDGALEVVKKNSFDLILIDISLYGRDTGLEILKEIRKTDKQTLVYILTAYTDYEEKAIAAGADKYIMKPLNYQEHIFKPLGVEAGRDRGERKI